MPESERSGALDDTKRLEFLMRFLTVGDDGDESVCPGVQVESDDMKSALDLGCVGEKYCLVDGWVNPDMRRVIDKAMYPIKRMEAEMHVLEEKRRMLAVRISQMENGECGDQDDATSV